MTPPPQETHQARVRAQGALGSADDELQRLQRDAAMLARQLDEEHGELEQALASKGNLEVRVMTQEVWYCDVSINAILPESNLHRTPLPSMHSAWVIYCSVFCP